MECPLCGSVKTQTFLSAEQDVLDRKDYWECSVCCLVFVHKRHHLDPAEEKSRYDLHQNHPQDEGYVRFLNRLAEPLAGFLKPRAEGLDFGCGPGPVLSQILNQKGFQVSNYDPFYFPDTTLLERTYDFITCSETAEHFYHPGREFELLHKMLRSGGVLGVMTDFLTMPERFPVWHYRRDPAHVCFYRQKTFEFLGMTQGWECFFPAANVVILKKK